MDDATIDGTLAYVAYKLETERKREVAEEVAKRLYRATGTIDADRLRADFETAWLATEDGQLKHEVARIAQGAVEGHDLLATEATGMVQTAEAKVATAEDDLANAQSGLAQAQADADAEAGHHGQAKTDAQALLDGAVAQGGDPDRAVTPGERRSVPDEVAVAVSALIGDPL